MDGANIVPASLSMLWAYELDMILADSSAAVIPALATRHHPFIYSLKHLVEQSIAGNGPLGPIDGVIVCITFDSEKQEFQKDFSWLERSRLGRKFRE